MRAAHWPGVVEILRGNGVDIVLHGHDQLVEHAIALLPPRYVDRDVALLAACLAALAGRPHELRRRLLQAGAARAGGRVDPQARVLATIARAGDALLTGDLPDGSDVWARILEGAEPIDPAVRILALATSGRLHAFANHLDAATEVLARADGLAVAAGYQWLHLDILASQAVTAAGRGDLHGVVEHTATARCLAGARGWMRSPAMAVVYGAAAWTAWQRADDDALRDHLRDAAQIVGEVPVLASITHQLLGAYLSATVDPDHSALRTTTTRVWARTRTLPASAPRPFIVFYGSELSAALRARDLAWIREIQLRAAKVLSEDELRLGAAARAIAADRPAAALSTLTAASTDDEYAALWRELLIVTALLANSQETAAREHLMQAFALAAPSGLWRPFLEAPPSVSALIVSHSGRFGQFEELAAPIVDRLRSQATDRPAAPRLAPKEQEVLRELPSDLTVAEIARSRTVSENTVRTQLRSIYRKLGVTTRRDAVRRAHETGLL